MEYIDGRTLIRMSCLSAVRWSWRRPAKIASQLLAGLAAIHDAGLVHRDLKPENVMLTRSGPGSDHGFWHCQGDGRGLDRHGGGNPRLHGPGAAAR